MLYYEDIQKHTEACLGTAGLYYGILKNAWSFLRLNFSVAAVAGGEEVSVQSVIASHGKCSNIPLASAIFFREWTDVIENSRPLSNQEFVQSHLPNLEQQHVFFCDLISLLSVQLQLNDVLDLPAANKQPNIYLNKIIQNTNRYILRLEEIISCLKDYKVDQRPGRQISAQESGHDKRDDNLFFCQNATEQIQSFRNSKLNWEDQHQTIRYLSCLRISDCCNRIYACLIKEMGDLAGHHLYLRKSGELKDDDAIELLLLLKQNVETIDVLEQLSVDMKNFICTYNSNNPYFPGGQRYSM